jgi:hypothetical protein
LVSLEELADEPFEVVRLEEGTSFEGREILDQYGSSLTWVSLLPFGAMIVVPDCLTSTIFATICSWVSRGQCPAECAAIEASEPPAAAAPTLLGAGPLAAVRGSASRP